MEVTTVDVEEEAMTTEVLAEVAATLDVATMVVRQAGRLFPLS